jgi:hypothetical protein
MYWGGIDNVTKPPYDLTRTNVIIKDILISVWLKINHVTDVHNCAFLLGLLVWMQTGTFPGSTMSSLNDSILGISSKSF